MRSTFSVLFYTKNQSLKDGKVPIMGRITINKTTACFSCKREVSLALWDAKAKRAKGKSDEARRLNQELDNIKAQITRHYQYVCDHDSLVTAKSVYNRYLGFGDDYHTLMGLFREQLASYKEKIGKEKAASTYRGLVADYKNLQLFLKEKRRIEDIAIAELDKKFIEDYYNWMLGTCALASSTAFGRVNTLKWLMYTAQERGWIRLHPFIGFDCLPEYKRRSFLTEEDLQSVIHVKLNYKRQRLTVGGFSSKVGKSDGESKTTQKQKSMEKKQARRTGRKPKTDPADYKYNFRLNAQEKSRFEKLFLESGARDRTIFIKKSIFSEQLKVIKVDKVSMDYYIRLGEFYRQFQAIGNNYNQVVRAVQKNFGDKRAMSLLYKLEKATLELILLNKQIMALTKEYEQKWLQR